MRYRLIPFRVNICLTTISVSVHRKSLFGIYKCWRRGFRLDTLYQSFVVFASFKLRFVDVVELIMQWFYKVVDFLLIRVVWTCYLICNALFSKKNKEVVQNEQATASDQSLKKRHFIHLYTTTSPNGRPECYMDVYEMNSPSDEKILRDVCAKGVPNSTYWRCHRDTQRDKYVPKAWIEYSTIAM